MHVIAATIVSGIVDSPRVPVVAPGQTAPRWVGKVYNGSEWVCFEEGDAQPADPRQWDAAVPRELLDRVTLPAGSSRKSEQDAVKAEAESRLGG